ncbi:HMW glutenin [Trema orientale]|uniref:HMW glutenin n=1 Tax=Trema orientale TaxID=63057 RepID=A0A2P5FRL8_TREOI|nr:HMW glutenin [Trema orientale]
MAKLSSSAALLAALLLVAHAAAFRTTITTIETSDNYGEGGSRQECRQQVQGRDLSHCRMFMMEETSRRGGGGRRDDELVNYSQHLDQCCNQLRQINERCRCEGLRMEIERQKGQIGREDMREMMRTAENIPSMCRMGPSSCEFESPYLF